MNQLSIVHGSLSPKLRSLLTTNGVVQDLTGATVKLYLERLRTGVIWTNGATASLVAPSTSGQVEYAWQLADWSTLEANGLLGDGMYRGQWEVLNLSPSPVWFPTEDPGYFYVHVLPKVS